MAPWHENGGWQTKIISGGGSGINMAASWLMPALSPESINMPSSAGQAWRIYRHGAAIANICTLINNAAQRIAAGARIVRRHLSRSNIIFAGALAAAA
jgi:hypothetical protein